MKHETLWDRAMELAFNITDMFKSHPHSKGLTYFNHLIYALGYVILLSVACVFLTINAFFPFMFKNVPSTLMEDVLDKLKGK